MAAVAEEAPLATNLAAVTVAVAASGAPPRNEMIVDSSVSEE